MKKALSILLSAVMLLGLLSACSPIGTETATETPAVSESPTVSVEGPTESAGGAGAFTPGNYTSTQQGHNGMVTVETTFGADRIEAVNVTEHQ